MKKTFDSIFFFFFFFFWFFKICDNELFSSLPVKSEKNTLDSINSATRPKGLNERNKKEKTVEKKEISTKTATSSWQAM